MKIHLDFINHVNLPEETKLQELRENGFNITHSLVVYPAAKKLRVHLAGGLSDVVPIVDIAKLEDLIKLQDCFVEAIKITERDHAMIIVETGELINHEMSILNNELSWLSWIRT